MNNLTDQNQNIRIKICLSEGSNEIVSLCVTRKLCVTIKLTLALRGYFDKYAAIFFFENYLYVIVSEREDDLLDLEKLNHLGFYIRSTMVLIMAIKLKLKSQLSVFTN